MAALMGAAVIAGCSALGGRAFPAHQLWEISIDIKACAGARLVLQFKSGRNEVFVLPSEPFLAKFHAASWDSLESLALELGGAITTVSERSRFRDLSRIDEHLLSCPSRSVVDLPDSASNPPAS